MLIEHRRLLTLYKNTLLIFSYILKAKYIFSIGRWIGNLLEKWGWIHYSLVVYLLLRNKILSNDIILHKLEWRHGIRLVTGLRRRSLASVSPCGGGGEGTTTRRLNIRLHRHWFAHKRFVHLRALWSGGPHLLHFFFSLFLFLILFQKNNDIFFGKLFLFLCLYLRYLSTIIAFWQWQS